MEGAGGLAALLGLGVLVGEREVGSWNPARRARAVGVPADQAFFTDCLRRYLVTTGTGSQGAAMERAYASFAAARGLPPVSLPECPSDAVLVRTALDADEGGTAARLRESGADLVVTLGQPAADLPADVVGTERVVLRRDATYGARRHLRLVDRAAAWLPLEHPGQRQAVWEQHRRS